MTTKEPDRHGVQPEEEDDRAKFERLYEELQRFRETPPVIFSSRTPDHNDCEASRQIVAGGHSFVPFIIEKIREGDFFTNQTMCEITGIDPNDVYKDARSGGEQDESRQWLRWWEDNKGRYQDRSEEGA